MDQAWKTRSLCIFLVLQAVVSYRSIPRILALFHATGHGSSNWIPHFTSVINWTLRLGLGLLEQVKPTTRPWIAIIDHSIDIGTKKALVVLRVTTDALSKREKAIRLEDCECIGLTIAEKVDGESISKELETIFNKAGTPLAILKDCDRTLQKGVKQWADRQDTIIYIIDDLGHVMASALKAQFEKTEEYKRFTTLVSSGAKKLRQTDLAFLTPPKLRTKGRFQSIGKLAKWGEKMLNVLKEEKSDQPGDTLERLHAAFPDLSQCSQFIENFANAANVLSQAMEVLKNKGLDQSSFDRCQVLSEKLPPDSRVRHRLSLWLQQHLTIQKKTSPLPLPISSDIIESLFGNFKHILQRSPQADMNRTTLLLPALCGTLDEAAIMKALSHASHAELEDWVSENIPYTLRKKRHEFFHSKKANNRENNSSFLAAISTA